MYLKVHISTCIYVHIYVYTDTEFYILLVSLEILSVLFVKMFHKYFSNCIIMSQRTNMPKIYLTFSMC